MAMFDIVSDPWQDQGVLCYPHLSLLGVDSAAASSLEGPHTLQRIGSVYASPLGAPRIRLLQVWEHRTPRLSAGDTQHFLRVPGVDKGLLVEVGTQSGLVQRLELEGHTDLVVVHYMLW